MYFQIGRGKMKTWNKKKKPKHHSKVKYKIIIIHTLSYVYEAAEIKHGYSYVRDCKRNIIRLSRINKKYKTVSKQTYKKKY